MTVEWLSLRFPWWARPYVCAFEAVRRLQGRGPR